MKGFVSITEALALHRGVRERFLRQPFVTGVEIGSRKGRSSIVMALALWLLLYLGLTAE